MVWGVLRNLLQKTRESPLAVIVTCTFGSVCTVSSIAIVIALAGDAKTNGTTAAAKVSAAVPVRAFNGLSVMIFLRLWKIPPLTTSLPRSPKLVAQGRGSFDRLPGAAVLTVCREMMIASMCLFACIRLWLTSPKGRFAPRNPG
jgi:hypothetical protein